MAELTNLEQEMGAEATRQLRFLLKAIRQLVETGGQNKSGGQALTGYYAMTWQHLLSGQAGKRLKH